MEMGKRSTVRHLANWLLMLGLGVTTSGKAASGIAAPNPGDSDAAIKYRYKGIPGGGELYIDATFHTRGRSLIYNARGILFARGQFAPGGGQHRSYFGDEKSGGLPIPKSLRMLRYPLDAKVNHQWDYVKFLDDQPPYFGEPLVDVTVPVASRIPDAVLDRIRKYKGSLKLKLRLTPETILVGWEVRNGRSYPFKRDQWGNAYVTDEDVMIGGDFCEAQAVDRFVDGKIRLIRKKGWQIDPATGQRVETDF